jgi:hypothetical protein
MFAGCYLFLVRCQFQQINRPFRQVALRVGSDALGLVLTSLTRSHASDTMILIFHVLSTTDINSVEVEFRTLPSTGQY